MIQSKCSINAVLLKFVSFFRSNDVKGIRIKTKIPNRNREIAPRHYIPFNLGSTVHVDNNVRVLFQIYLDFMCTIKFTVKCNN